MVWPATDDNREIGLQSAREQPRDSALDVIARRDRTGSFAA